MDLIKYGQGQKNDDLRLVKQSRKEIYYFDRECISLYTWITVISPTHLSVETPTQCSH